MFQKLVAIEPVGLTSSALEKLREFAAVVKFYDNRPSSDGEIIKRIGDADAALLTYTSAISGTVLRACPNLKYVGMCNTLYSEESANVDIKTARELGIVVKGINGWGDQGVAEYVVSELIRYLHGYGEKKYAEMPIEITGLKIGIVGLGATGTLVAKVLQAFGADVSYYSRTRKPLIEQNGVMYFSLRELLSRVDVLCTCLTKNSVLLGDDEFRILGNHKILFNTSIGPSFDLRAVKQWLSSGNNELFCDSEMALGDMNGLLTGDPHVNAQKVSSGVTKQAYDRLSAKVIENIRSYIDSKVGIVK